MKCTKIFKKQRERVHALYKNKRDLNLLLNSENKPKSLIDFGYLKVKFKNAQFPLAYILYGL